MLLCVKQCLFCLLNLYREIGPKSPKPYVKIEEDTYLTLEILAAILEKLSESGKSMHSNSFANVRL